MPDSSSTMRMLCMLSGRCGQGFDSQRKFHDETSAYWLILFYTDRSAVILDNAADDGQTQSRSALLGREVRQKKLFLQFLRNAMACIRYDNLDGVVTVDEASRDPDLAYQRALHGFSGIVDQVCQCSLDRFSVSHYLGQAGRKFLLQADAIEAAIEHTKRAVNYGVDASGVRLGRGETCQRRELVHERAHRVDGSRNGLRAVT